MAAIHVERDAVHRACADAARGDEARKISLLFKGIILRYPGGIDEVHRFFHLLFNKFIVRGQGEKKLVESFNMSFVFRLAVILHVSTYCNERNIPVKDVYMLSLLGRDFPGIGKSKGTDDNGGQH